MSEHDDWNEYRKLLRRWEAPEAPPSLDRRMTQSLAARGARNSIWRRLVTARISVPVPVAVAFALLLALTAASAFRQRTSPPVGPPATVIRDGGTDLRVFRPPAEIRLTIIKEGDRR